MRPLRVLPARLPHLSVLGPGNGLAPRANLPDEGPHRGSDSTVGGRETLRPLPRLPGVRHRLPFGREVRSAHRADAGGGRRARAPPPPRTASAHVHFRDFSLSAEAPGAGGASMAV